MITNWIKPLRERRETTHRTLSRLGQSSAEGVAVAMIRDYGELYRRLSVAKVERYLSALAREGRVRKMPVSHDVTEDEGVLYEVVA